MLGTLSVAKNFYDHAVAAWPDLAPAQYGLAQMLAHQAKALEIKGGGLSAEGRKMHDDAISALEKVSHHKRRRRRGTTLWIDTNRGRGGLAGIGEGS